MGFPPLQINLENYPILTLPVDFEIPKYFQSLLLAKIESDQYRKNMSHLEKKYIQFIYHIPFYLLL
jgi:hypothetical protein